MNGSEAIAALMAAGASEGDAASCVRDAVDMGRGVGYAELPGGPVIGVAADREGVLVLLTGYTRQALSAMQSEAHIWRYGDGHSARRSWDESKAWAARIGADWREHQAWVHHDQSGLNYAAVCEAAREAGDPWIVAHENPAGPAREASSGTEPVTAQSAPASAPGAMGAAPDRSAARRASADLGFEGAAGTPLPAARAAVAQAMNGTLAGRAIAEAIWTAGRSPGAAGITVREGPGHPLAYHLCIPDAIARALGLCTGAYGHAAEQIRLSLGMDVVTLLSAETGPSWTTITLKLGDASPAVGPPLAMASRIPAPGLAVGQDFPSALALTPAVNTGRREPARGIAAPTRQAQPGRRQ